MDTTNSNSYCVPTDEDFEPNSNNEVVKNYLNIKSAEAMGAVEEQELERAELELLKLFDHNHLFTVDDICNIHELWLGDIYPSAGKYRTVTLSKYGFSFAPSQQIELSMQAFEKKYLVKYTPCHYSDLNALAHALGVVHIEFCVIHPFRKGSGRTARLLADLMAMQANMPPLNFSDIDQTKNKEGFEKYMLAIRAGANGDYEPIQKIFHTLLEHSII